MLFMIDEVFQIAGCEHIRGKRGHGHAGAEFEGDVGGWRVREGDAEGGMGLFVGGEGGSWH